MSAYLAANLTGKVIGKWTVVSKVNKPDGSGGGFSSGYLVEANGRRAYMKALNVEYAFTSTGQKGSIMDALKELTDDFVHERDLLNFCRDHDMDRIVVALDSGEYSETGDPFPVPYLIFELCEAGDLRRNPGLALNGLDWPLHVFHGTAIAVAQLHAENIAHQDIKPPNVLVFDNQIAKLADLGRSTIKMPGARFGNPADHGDIYYCPFELYYGHYDSDWDIRRKGTDIFMLGGLLVFLVAKVHLVGLVFSKLPAGFHYRQWRGTYQDVLPALEHAFNLAVDEIVTPVRSDMRTDLKEMIIWLCNPIPSRRGHPKTVIQASGNRFSLERIISVADRLSKKARLPNP